MESTFDETGFELGGESLRSFEEEALRAIRGPGVGPPSIEEMSRNVSGRMREALREAVIAYRSAQANAGEPSRELRSLPRGKWELVDNFESRGRRYVVVVLADRSGIDALTPREREVLGRAAKGETNKVIAYELGLSASTVRVLMARARAKLGARSGAEAAKLLTGRA